ncbi:hypothetical protein BJ742DRAFT_804420 [Cladochytrium replicatum]|nr:hypothetical protein BJ742DRAFT_804420 [Cladochytrium replicatum]
MKDTDENSTVGITDSHVRFADPHALVVWNGDRTAPPAPHEIQITVKCRCKQTRICPNISVSRSLGLFPNPSAMSVCRRLAINQRCSEILLPHSAFWQLLRTILNGKGPTGVAYFPFSIQELANRRWVLSYVASALEVGELGWEDVALIFEGETVKIVVMLWWNDEDRGRNWETYLARSGELADLESRFGYDCEEDWEAGILRSPREYSPRSARFSRLLWGIFEADDQTEDPTWKIWEENVCDMDDDTIDHDREMETESDTFSCTPSQSTESEDLLEDSELQPRPRNTRESVVKKISARQSYLQVTRYPQTGGKKLPPSMFFSGKKLPVLKRKVRGKRSRASGKRVRFDSETESVTTEPITEDDDNGGFDSHCKEHNDDDDEHGDELNEEHDQRELGSATFEAVSMLADDDLMEEDGPGEIAGSNEFSTSETQEKSGEIPDSKLIFESSCHELSVYTISVREKRSGLASTYYTQQQDAIASTTSATHKDKSTVPARSPENTGSDFDSFCEKVLSNLLEDFQVERWYEHRKHLRAKDRDNIVSAFFGDYSGSDEEFQALMEKAGINLLNDRY